MAADSEGTGLASSLTDLMTSLAVIFILLLVASHNNEQQKFEEQQDHLASQQQKLDEAKEKTGTMRSQLLLELQNALKRVPAEGVGVEADRHDPLGLIVIVPDQLLFASDEDKMPREGVKFLSTFTPELARTVCSDKFEKEISAIVIEGHTDSRGTDDHNLRLSQRRSMTVVRESLDALSKTPADPSGSSMLRECFLNFLSASGRGRREPRCPDLRCNRRVEFKIRVRSLEQRQVQEGLSIDSSLKQ